MALIQCPECGTQISDSSKQCVHCGYQFLLCPECGKATGITEKYCKHCGYEIPLQKEEPINKVSKSPTPTNDNCVEAWRQSSSLARISNTLSRNVTWAFLVIGVLLLLFVGIRLIFLSNSFEALVFQPTGKVLLIIAFVCFALFKPIRYLNSFYRISVFCDWLKFYNIDPIIALKRYEKIQTHQEYENCDLLLEAGFMMINPLIKKVHQTDYILSSFFSTIFLTCLAIFTIQNFENYIWYGSDFDFQYFFLILAGIIFIVWTIQDNLFIHYIEKGTKLWVEKIYPGFIKMKDEAFYNTLNI